MMTPQMVFFAWTSILSLAMAISPSLNQATLYPTVASQKNLQAQITSIEEKLRNMDEMRTWPSNSRLSDVMRRIDLLDNRVARIEIFLERKMDVLQDKLAYLEGKLETRLDKIQASLDTMSTRSDRGLKLMTNKVVDLERTVLNVRHYCNVTARNQAEQLPVSQQIQDDGLQADSLVEKLNKNIELQIGNITHKLNNWYNDLWRRSNNLESLLKNENNQSRWEVYEGIMQILNRWEITDETIHDIESSLKERYADLTTTHKEIIRSISDKENKLAGILDGFLNVLVFNATYAFSQIQLTQELIKSHNSHMVRTIDSTNKLVLSCQEDNKALKSALLLTGAQYKLEWDTKHDKLREDIGSTQLHISKTQNLLEGFIEQSNNKTISIPVHALLSTLQDLEKNILEITKSSTVKCNNNIENSSKKYDITNKLMNSEINNETTIVNTNNSSKSFSKEVSSASPDEMLTNITQVDNFLSGIKDANKEIISNSNIKKTQLNSTNFQSLTTSDYADTFAPDIQDYDDVEEEYTE